MVKQGFTGRNAAPGAQAFRGGKLQRIAKSI
jgi:hypothetical protein